MELNHKNKSDIRIMAKRYEILRNKLNPIMEDETWNSAKILEALKTKSDIWIFSLKFRNLCHQNGYRAEKIFYEAIIQSSGVLEFKYRTFQRNYLIDLVNNKNSVTTQQPYIMKKNFQENFNKFLSFTFGDGKEAIIFCFPNLVNIVEIFLTSSWDSMRIMATFVGIKYLSGFYNLPSQIHNNPPSMTVKNDLTRLKDCVILNGMRDVSETIHEVIAREFMLWSEQYPLWMIESTMINLVLKILDSKFEKVKCFAFDTVKKLVKSNHLDQLRRKKLTIEKSVLQSFGIENHFVFETTIKILYKLVSHFGPLETANISHLETILACFSFNNREVERKGSIVVIKTLKKDLNFHDFWLFFVVRLTASELDKLFKWYFFEEVGPVLILNQNSESLKEIINNEKYFCEGLKSLKIALAANEGIKYWFDLLHTMHTFQEKLFIENLPYLIQCCEETVEAVWGEVEDVFYATQDLQVCVAAWETLATLEEKHRIVKGKISSIASDVFDKFMADEANSTIQFHAMTKFSFDDEKYWKECVEVLKLSADDYSEYCEKMFYMMNFLFERTFIMNQKIDSLIEEAKAIQDPKKNDEVTTAYLRLQMTIFFRLHDLESLFFPALSSHANQRLRYQACYQFIDIYNLFGPHVWDDLYRFTMLFNFDEHLIPKLVQTIVTMPCGKEMCCKKVKDFLNLLSDKKVELVVLMDFLFNFEKFPHFDLVIDFIIEIATNHYEIKNVAIIVNDVLEILSNGQNGTQKIERILDSIIYVCKDFKVFHQLLCIIKHQIKKNSRGRALPLYSSMIDQCTSNVQNLLF